MAIGYSRELALSEWSDTIRRDYLQSYIPSGGSSVKVVVAPPDVRVATSSALSAEAARAGLLYAHVDSGTRRVHLVHQFLYDVASQIPWERLARNVVCSVLRDKDYKIPENGDLSIEALAEVNDVSRTEIVQPLRTAISTRVFQNYALSREFRSAAASLCHAVYDPTPDVRKTAEDAQMWLQGSVLSMTLLRRIGIFRKIGRANARQIFYSLAEWIPACGEPGMVITVDVARYVLGKDAEPNAGIPPYTKLAELDFSEVLRQFIDGIDDLRSTLLVFLTDERFVRDDKRGLRAYDALRLRLTDDVRDRNRPNPLAPMVLLGAAS